MTPLDFEKIERSWQPGPFIRLLESNPITRIFWNVIKFCFGYDEEYRCTDWNNYIQAIRTSKESIPYGNENYPSYYWAVQNVLYYNPHLRQEFQMKPPPTSTHLPPSGSIHITASRFAGQDNHSGHMPPADQVSHVAAGTLHSRMPLPAAGVPLSQQASVPPMDARSAGTPLSQQQGHGAPVSPFSLRAVPLAQQNVVPPMDAPSARTPLSQQQGHGAPVSPFSLRAVPLAQQAAVPPMDAPSARTPLSQQGGVPQTASSSASKPLSMQNGRGSSGIDLAEEARKRQLPLSKRNGTNR